MPLRRVLLPALALALLVAGCAERSRTADDPRFAARRALEAVARQGPVRAVVVAAPFPAGEGDAAELVTRAFADGIAALGVDFTTDPARAAAPEPHLVVALNPTRLASGGLACRAPQEIGTRPIAGTTAVLAAFCDGPEPLGVVRTEGDAARPSDRRLERLLWRTASALFPDDYWDSYGFGLLPDWLNVEVGGSAGF